MTYPNKNKVSTEARQAASDRLKLLHQDPAFVAKLRSSARAAMKRKWAEDQEYRDRMTASASFFGAMVVGGATTPEGREEISRQMKLKWSDPAFRDKQSKSRKALWLRPEYREKGLVQLENARKKKISRQEKT